MRDLIETLEGRLKPRETQEPATLGEAMQEAGMSHEVLVLPLIPPRALQQGLGTLAIALGGSDTATRLILSELPFSVLSLNA